jgi:MFS family permease
VTFFIASAGASSAYLTVSEVFPMESRALCIALFFAVGTAVGGITGPLLFGQFINSGSRNLVAVGFLIGAGVMLLGGVAEMFFGVRAEQQSLENIARPLTAEEAEAESEGREPAPQPDLGARGARMAERRVRQSQRERAGGRRYAPGVGSSFYSPGMAGTGGQNSRTAAMAEEAEDREIEEVSDALRVNGTMDRATLEKLVKGRAWGPGRFRRALGEAVFESRARRTSAHAYSPPEGGNDD